MIKLFIWNTDSTLVDYGHGMIAVLANDLAEALRLIEEKHPHCMGNFNPNEYKIIKEPEAFICWGSS